MMKRAIAKWTERALYIQGHYRNPGPELVLNRKRVVLGCTVPLPPFLIDSICLNLHFRFILIIQLRLWMPATT